MKILLTGATGFLGAYLVEALISQVETLYLLVRPESWKKAQAKYRNKANVVLIKGDLANTDIFSDEKDHAHLREQLTGILHAAALYNIEGDYEESYLANVVGTQNLLYFASSCFKLKDFHYVSTIAVAGDYEGVFLEDDLEKGQGFSNHYAKTKYEAELLVRQWKKEGVRRKIYRPGIIVGESLKGSISKTDGPYFFFRFLLELKKKHPTCLSLMKFFPLPYAPKTLLPLVPVDKAAEFIVSGFLHSEVWEELSCYHVFALESPTTKVFLHDVLKAFGIKAKSIPLPRSGVNAFLFKRLQIPQELLSYMYTGLILDQKYFKSDLCKEKSCYYQDFRDTMLHYASKEMEYL